MSTNYTTPQDHTTPDQPKQLHPQGRSRLQATAEIIGVSSMTLRRWWAADKFPKPIHINGIPMFRNSDLLAWLEESAQSNEAEA